MAINALPRRIARVAQLVGCDPHHAAVPLVQLQQAVRQHSLVLPVAPGETGGGPECWAGVLAEGVQEDVVEDLGYGVEGCLWWEWTGGQRWCYCCYCEW